MKKVLSWIIVITTFLTAVQIDIYAAGKNEEKMYEEAMEFYKAEDYDRAFARFQISGEVRGYAPAQNMLGVCYRDGLGTEQDLEKAEEYFRLSANQGYAPAQENLASLFSEDIPEAADEPAQPSTPVSTQASTKDEKDIIPWAKTVKVGDTVEFGSYEQDNDLTNDTEAIEWLVLDVQDGKAMLLSKYALDCQLYNLEDGDWEKSSLRTWLNGTFYDQAFSDTEKNQLLFTAADTEMKISSTITPSNKSNDLVFILSLQEVSKYLNSNTTARCIPTRYAIAEGAFIGSQTHYWDNEGTDSQPSIEEDNTFWWLRSGNRINPSGILHTQIRRGNTRRAETAVRPAVWISLHKLSERAEIAQITSVRDRSSVPDFSWTENAVPGEYISFGAYEQDNDFSNGKEPIEWLVLDVKDGKALLLSRYALDAKKYSLLYQSDWESSYLRRWLNNSFVAEAFEDVEKDRVCMTAVSADMNSDSGSSVTDDQVFVLDIAEVKEYLISDSDRKCSPTEFAHERHVSKYNEKCWWWLRSLGNIVTNAAVVSVDGTVDSAGRAFGTENIGVRPALWVSVV